MPEFDDNRLDQELQLTQVIKKQKDELKKLLDLNKQDKKTLEKIGKLRKELFKDEVKLKNLRKKIAEETKKEMNLQGIISDYAHDLQKTLQKMSPELKKHRHFTGTIRDTGEEAVNLAEKALETQGSLGSAYELGANLNKDINDLELAQLENSENIGTSLYDQGTIEQDLLDRKKDIRNLENIMANEGHTWNQEQQKQVSDLIERKKDQLNVQEKINLENEIQNEQIQAAADHVGGIFDNIRSSLEMLPGGGLLASFVLPEAVIKQFKEQTANIFSEMAKGAISSQEAFQMIATEGIGVLKTAMEALKVTWMGIPIVAILVSAIGTFKILQKSVEYMRETMGDIADQFGSAGVNMYSEQIRGAAIATTHLGMETSDVVESTQELVSNWGFGMENATNMFGQVAEISKKYAMQVGDAAKLVGIFDNLTSLSMEQSLATADMGGNLALAADLAPADIMAEVANNSDLVAKYTKRGAKGIFEMAVEAKKLGMEMNDLATIADGLIDIEASMGAEMEFMALTGRQVNLTRARQLALDEEWGELNKELVNVFGDQAYWAHATVIEKQLMADMLNTDIAGMAKIVNQEEEVYNLSKAMANQPSMTEMLGTDSIDQISRLVYQIKKLGKYLWETFGPTVMYVVGMFASMFEWIDKTPAAAFALKSALVILATAMALITGRAILQLFVFAHQMAMMAAKATGPLAPLTYAATIGGLIMTVRSGIAEAGSTATQYKELAAGGVVTSPTRALMGEAGPEAVIPLSNNAAMERIAGSGGAGTRKEIKGLREQTQYLTKVMMMISDTLNGSLGPKGDLPSRIAKKDPMKAVVNRTLA